MSMPHRMKSLPHSTNCNQLTCKLKKKYPTTTTIKKKKQTRMHENRTTGFHGIVESVVLDNSVIHHLFFNIRVVNNFEADFL